MDISDRATTITFLLRDRDSRFTSAFDAVFAADGIRILTSPPQAPRANALCERMIANPAPRTARRDPGRQRTPSTPDPHELSAPCHYRAATPDTRPTRTGTGRNPAPTRDQPRRLPGSPQSDPRRAHPRVSDRIMIKLDTHKPAGQAQNPIFEPQTRSVARSERTQPPSAISTAASRQHPAPIMHRNEPAAGQRPRQAARGRTGRR
jgi:hypothetical protein